MEVPVKIDLLGTWRMTKIVDWDEGTIRGEEANFSFGEAD